MKNRYKLSFLTLFMVFSFLASVSQIQWTGTVSDDWHTVGNWDAGVPTSGDNVIIPQVGTMPVISGPLAECNDITIEEDAVLIIADDGQFTIHGDLTNEGLLEILSTENGDGSLLINGDRLGEGNYKVHRWLRPTGTYEDPPGGRYHLVSSPNVVVNAGTVFGGLYLFPHLEEVFDWGTPISNPGHKIYPMEGYLLWTPEEDTRVFRGKINNGEIGPVEVYRSGIEDYDGFNLIGNPYPSAIDWRAETGWVKDNLDPVIWIWNDDRYGMHYQLGLSWHSLDGGSRYISSGQSFFVRAFNVPGGSISVNNNARVHNSVPFRSNEELIQPNDVIKVTVEGNNSKNEIAIHNYANSSSNYCSSHDIIKLFGASHAPQLYTKKDGVKLSASSFSDIGAIHEQSIYLEVGAETDYTMSFTHTMVEHDEFYIKDLFTNDIFAADTEYTFTAQPGDNPERFQILTGISDIEALNKEQIAVWNYNNILNVNIPNGEKLHKIDVYNSLGSLVLTSKSNETNLSELSSGIYLVNVKTDKQSVVNKIFVK